MPSKRIKKDKKNSNKIKEVNRKINKIKITLMTLLNFKLNNKNKMKNKYLYWGIFQNLMNNLNIKLY